MTTPRNGSLVALVTVTALLGLVASIAFLVFVSASQPSLGHDAIEAAVALETARTWFGWFVVSLVATLVTSAFLNRPVARPVPDIPLNRAESE